MFQFSEIELISCRLISWALVLTSVIACSRGSNFSTAQSQSVGNYGTLTFKVSCPTMPYVCINRTGAWQPPEESQKNVAKSAILSFGDGCKHSTVIVPELTKLAGSQLWQGHLSVVSAAYTYQVACKTGGVGIWGGNFSLAPGENKDLNL